MCLEQIPRMSQRKKYAKRWRRSAALYLWKPVVRFVISILASVYSQRIPPVFIVVCNNTATSQLVYEWISGFERIRDNDDERPLIHKGHLDLFRNYDEYC